MLAPKEPLMINHSCLPWLTQTLRPRGTRGLGKPLFSQLVGWGCIEWPSLSLAAIIKVWCELKLHALLVHPTPKRMPDSGFFLQTVHPLGALCSRKPPLLILARNNSLLTSSVVLWNLQHFFLTPSLYSNYMKQGPWLFPAYKKKEADRPWWLHPQSQKGSGG